MSGGGGGGGWGWWGGGGCKWVSDEVNGGSF